jgi:hypothetical protein
MSGSISVRQGKDDCGVPLSMTVANVDPHHYYLKKVLFGDPNGVDIPNIHYLFKVY